MKIEHMVRYYEIAKLYDEIDGGGDETSARKKIGKIVRDNNLDKRICDLMRKSIGVRAVFKGFHDDSVVYVNMDKSDCQIVMYGFGGLRDMDCPYRLRFEGVVGCMCKSPIAFSKEEFYCDRQELDLMHDGNIAVTFTFSNHLSERYVSQVIQIICKDVTFAPAPEVRV